MKKILLLVIIAAMAAGLAYARPIDAVHSIDLPTINTELKTGEGKDKAAIFCNICHSLDYITMQPAFQRAQWTATVNKMIKVMGAPIGEEDAKIIINYLVKNYGKGD
jgi:hypothetical protein